MKGFVRPKATVLGKSAIVPDGNLISPAPNQFTHALTREQSYYYTGAQREKKPDGVLQAGTKVVLFVYDGGVYCRVVDGQGLYVETEYGGLRTLNTPESKKTS